MEYAAVVLAGGINRRELYPGYEPGYKATLEIGGHSLVSRVLQALQTAETVGPIAIVGDREALGLDGDYRWAPPGESFLESLKAGLTLFQGRHQVLLVTADLPLLRAEMVDEFVRRCEELRSPAEQSLHLSLVPEARFTGAFARCRKNMNRFRDVSLCHGNLAMVTPALLRNRKAMGRIDAIYAGRLSPIRSALAIGPVLGLAYVLGVHFFRILSLGSFARLLGWSFGVGMVPVLVPHPEVAVDIDESADWQIAGELLG